MEDIPVNFILTEREAGISFNLVGGRADYAGFVGKDPIFRNWIKDLFLYYWIKENERDAHKSYSQYLNGMIV